MQACVRSGTLVGVEALLVDVEVDLAPGLPQTTTVGLPDGAVREARDRIRAALRASGFAYPQGRNTVNLAPAAVRKEGGRTTFRSRSVSSRRTHPLPCPISVTGACWGSSASTAASIRCAAPMLAQRLPSILPPLTATEAITVTAIYSVAGLLAKTPLVTARPVRAPHCSVSDAALLGGGTVPRPGEVTLAHHGVLFLDEFPEFRRNGLEPLRQPLEQRQITIARRGDAVVFRETPFAPPSVKRHPASRVMSLFSHRSEPTLARVRRGEAMTVTDRNRAVAVIVPAGTDDQEELVIRMLARTGRLAWSGGKPTGLTDAPRVRGSSVSEAVVEDRR